MAHTTRERNGTMSAKPAARRDASAKCPELIRAVRLTERQLDRADEVKPLPQRPWERSTDP